MMKNSWLDNGTITNSHAAMKRNYNFNQGDDAMTQAHNFNFNNHRSIKNSYGYDHNDWSHFAGNNNADMTIKKFIKNRIHSKRPKLQKLPSKVLL